MKKPRVYVHYGHDVFDGSLLSGELCIHESTYKPHGLWASPVKARYGWKQFCIDEDFHTERLNKWFRFTLSPNAKILHINSMKEAMKYMVADSKFPPNCKFPMYELDKEAISHFDGMELHITNDYANFRFSNVFYSWDVDSICIWNPNVIIPYKTQ